MNTEEGFEDPVSPRERALQAGAPDAAGGLVLDLEGFEGPIDLLLGLARDQKVDLTRISILQLADQYLDFISHARRLSLDIAAEYLVMAAWLAYLKSRLLLPPPDEDEAPSGEEMAALLAFQLRRLEAMRDAAERLFARPRLGRDFHARGEAEGLPVSRRPVYEATLYDLLSAYADTRRKSSARTLTIAPSGLYSIDRAVERLSRLLGQMPDWQELRAFLPEPSPAGEGAELRDRSALASTFVAGLELVKTGRLEMRQSAPYGPIFLRRAGPRPVTDVPPDESAAAEGRDE